MYFEELCFFNLKCFLLFTLLLVNQLYYLVLIAKHHLKNHIDLVVNVKYVFYFNYHRVGCPICYLTIITRNLYFDNMY